MKRTVLIVAGCATALLVAAPQSHATPSLIDISSYGEGNGEWGSTVQYTSGSHVVNDVGNVWSGVIDLHTAGDSTYMPSSILGVFCEDVFTDLNTGNPWFAATNVLDNGLGTTLSVTTQDEIGWLVNNYNNDGSGGGITKESLSLTQDEFASATQGAIWETEYGSSLIFASGDSLATTAATALTTDVENPSGPGPGFAGDTEEWEAWNHTTGQYDPTLNQGQTFIGTGGLTNDVPPVPEPASLVLLGAGLIGLAAVRRRTRG